MLKHCSKLSLLEEKSASTFSLCNVGITAAETVVKRSNVIKVWMEGSQGSYRTVVVNSLTTCQEVISRLVSRVRVRCADPKLHSLEMQVNIGPGNIKTVALEEDARLTEIVDCNPWDNYKFVLVTKKFSPIRVWDKISGDVVFRTLLVTRDCSVVRALDMINKFYPNLSRQSLAIYEESELLGFSKLLSDADILSRVTEAWEDECQFKLVLRKYVAPKCNSGIPTMKQFMQSMLMGADGSEHSFIEPTEDLTSDSSINSHTESEQTDASSINSESFTFVPCQ